MKHLLNILSLGLVLGLAACAADGTEGEESTVEQTAQPLLSSSSGGLSSGGLSNWCQAKLDCENNCIRMYPSSPIMQSQCKKIDQCASKCDSKLMFQ